MTQWSSGLNVGSMWEGSRACGWDGSICRLTVGRGFASVVGVPILPDSSCTPFFPLSFLSTIGNPLPRKRTDRYRPVRTDLEQFALTEASYVTVRLVQQFPGIESRDPEPWREKLTLTCTGLGGCKVGLVASCSELSHLED